MVSSHQARCLEPEVVAAYVDHGLSLAEQAQVETHLASCRQCTALLAGVVRTVAEVSAFIPDTGATEATPSQTRRTAITALGAAAAVVAVLVVPAVVAPLLERDAGLVSLVDSVGEQRSVLGRLSGGFPHAPLIAPSAGGQDGQAAGTDRVLLTAGRIRESFGELATPSRLHAVGVSQLLAGRYDDAVQSLLAASREQPANARYLSDVAAVQLERARLGLRPDDLPRALAAADRARRLDPSLNEAWFNRALAVSALSLTDQARSAWTDYLQRDSVSPWATEARARLEELSKPTPAAAWAALEGRLEQSIDAASADAAVRAQTTEARNFIENELFVDWANAVLAGNSGAAELDRARVMAEAMLRVAGDSLYRDAVGAIEQSGASSPEALARLARAHLQYAEAATLVSDDQHGAAAPRLITARQALAANGSPYQWRAALDYGASSYFNGDSVTAAPLLEQIVAKAQQSNYRFVHGRATWQQGLAAFQQGRLDVARARYENTLGTFENMGDVEQAGAAHNLLSGVFYLLGDSGAEWRHRQFSLNAISISRSLRYKYAVLASAAISSRIENPDAALAIQESALAIAKEWRRDAAIADVLAQRSSTLLQLGRVREAAEGVAEARERLQRVSDPAFRKIFELPVLAAESDLLRQQNSQQAALAAQQAIDIAVDRGDRARLPQFYLRLAKANIVGGRLGEAERALGAGITAFDQRRARLTDESGLSADDESWELFNTALRLAIRRGDNERAFAMAERSRATSLAEQRRLVSIPSLSEVQRTIRPNEAIVALNQFDDELAVWVIRSNGTSVLPRPIDLIDARRIVARQQEEIRQEASHPNASAELYDLIVRPLGSHLRGVTRIVFVPDTTYEAVSFAALWDRPRKAFLVERLTLSAAPNVTALYTAASRPVTARQLDRALVVAASADAAQTIAQEYQTSQVLTGSGMTRARFLAEAPGSSVVHLTLPTRPSRSYPLLSGVIFNDDPGQPYSGSVLGRDIASRPMPSTRLVVLDDIQAGPGYQTAGSFSLARAFLAAGVPAVLGTLPGADESSTRQMIVGFHRELASQASAAEALTRVQRNALQQNGRRIGAWTALVLYGSDR